MEKGQTITIDGKDYALKFTYGSFRELGQKWKLKGVSDVLKYLSETVGSVAETGLTFEQEDVIVDLIMAGLENPVLEDYDIIDSGILLDAAQLEKVFNLFSESFANLGKTPATPQPKAKKK